MREYFRSFPFEFGALEAVVLLASSVVLLKGGLMPSSVT
jgi:hypothetical protein